MARLLPRAPRVLLVTALASAALVGGVHAYGFGHCRTPFGYSRGIGYSSMAYGAFAYPSWGSYYDAGPSLSKEDLYLGSKEKGDRLFRRNHFSRAAEEYGNAHRRAVKLFGAGSEKAKKAQALRQRARDLYRRYGDASRPGSYLRAKRKGDAAMDRGDWDKAVAQYQDAMTKAHTDAQAKEAVAALVRAKDASKGRAPARARPLELAQDGDLAMARGDYGKAVGAYASALTRSLKRFGAGDSRTEALTAKLTRAQEAVSRGTRRVLDVGYAE